MPSEFLKDNLKITYILRGIILHAYHPSLCDEVGFSKWFDLEVYLRFLFFYVFLNKKNFKK